jgi:fibronectin-binding autotransporter adhesin
MVLKLLVACGAFVTTAVFAQPTNFIWTGPTGNDVGISTNWSPIGIPVANDAGSGQGDTMDFNGSRPGDLSLLSNTGSQVGASGGAIGINIHLESTQTSKVMIHTTLALSSGLRVNSFTFDSGSGQFSFGDTTLNVLDTIWGGAAGQIHNLVNNSANPAIFYPNLRLRYGGGGAHNLVFDGSGDWVITNMLITQNGSPTIITKQGSGNMFWTGTNVPGNVASSQLQGPMQVNGGNLVLKTSGLFPTAVQQIVFGGGQLTYDAGSGLPVGTGADIFGGTINGSGTQFQVNSGTLTLTSPNSGYGSPWLLSGGTLIVAGPEIVGTSGPLGIGGTITFTGGTLEWGGANNFDYSSRFDTVTASQAYKFNTGGQNVTLATTLGSTGASLTETGPGSLTLSAANSYSGPTHVTGNGKLVFGGSMTGTGSIVVDDGAGLGVTVTGTQVTPTSLSLGTVGGATYEINGLSSLSTAPLAANTLSSGGTLTININSSAVLTVGANYPLLSWTTGSAPGVSLGVLNGYVGNLLTNGNSIQLHIIATSVTWTGNNNGLWDLSQANNWIQNGGALLFANGTNTQFDDTSLVTNVTVNALVQPLPFAINTSTNQYTITSSGGNNIGGSTGLTKFGSSTTILAGGANTYTGITKLTEGTVSVSSLANGGLASDIGQAGNNPSNLVFNGGTLQYTGSGASIDRLFSYTSGGGTIDSSGSGPLTLANFAPLFGPGAGLRFLTLTGSNNATLASRIVDAQLGGATEVVKNGPNTWILTGTNNNYSGLTTINNGVLQIGAGGSTGTIGTGPVLNNAGLDFNSTATNLLVSGTVAGTGSVTDDGTGTVILAGNNSYTGGTFINTGTLQVGNGGGTGTLAINSPVTNNGTLVFNTTGTATLRGGNAIISGPGNLIVHQGTVECSGPNTYTGWTQIDSGATFQPCNGNEGQLATSVVTNNGTLQLIRQDFQPAVFGITNNIYGSGKVVKDNNNVNAGWVVLAGTNTYTGGTLINGGAIVLGDGINAGRGQIVGNVTFQNTSTPFKNPRTLIFNRPDTFTFTNNINSTVTSNDTANVPDRGGVWQQGPGTVTLTGTTVSYPGPTQVAGGMTLIIGNGGAGGAGSGGYQNGGLLIFNRSDNPTIGLVSDNTNGVGTLVKAGTGTLTITGNTTNIFVSQTNNNFATGSTTVSNGTLVVAATIAAGTNFVGGDLNVNGGAVIGGGAGVANTLLVGGNITINSGTIVASLNTAAAQSNSLFTITTTNLLTGLNNGIINNGGASSTLKLLLGGPLPVIGQKFTIFNPPIVNGNSMTIVSPGFTVSNNLGGDGSVTVTGVSPAPTITHVISGTNLNLSWPANWTGGVHLQSQTNPVTKGLSSNWVTIPGTDAGNTYTTPVGYQPGSTNKVATAFYRLVAP